MIYHVAGVLMFNIKSYVKPYLVAKTHPTNTPQQPFVTSTMVENIEYDIGAIAN